MSDKPCEHRFITPGGLQETGTGEHFELFHCLMCGSTITRNKNLNNSDFDVVPKDVAELDIIKRLFAELKYMHRIYNDLLIKHHYMIQQYNKLQDKFEANMKH